MLVPNWVNSLHARNGVSWTAAMGSRNVSKFCILLRVVYRGTDLTFLNDFETTLALPESPDYDGWDRRVTPVVDPILPDTDWTYIEPGS